MNKKSIKEKIDRESVWDYPHPPKIEDFPQLVKIVFGGEIVADSMNSKRVLEKGHPPVYYLPMQDINSELLKPSSRRTWCEWKGEASYYDILVGDLVAHNAAWFYPDPLPDFLDIKDSVAFYAGKMDKCYLEDEPVTPQAGDFYGGWITSKIEGPFKGTSTERKR